MESAADPEPQRGKTSLPAGSKRSWRARREKPSQEDVPAAGPSHRGALRLTRDDNERKRLLLASGLGGESSLARLGQSKTFVFRCPGCLQQVMCTEHDTDRETVCPFCEARLRLPPAESDSKVELLALPPSKADPAGTLLRGKLPELRDLDEGRSSNAAFIERPAASVDELEAAEGWGLSQPAKAAIAGRGRPWRWLLVLALLLGLAAWLLMSPRGRVEPASGERPASVAPAATDSQALFLAADTLLRAYLAAETIEEKAACARGPRETVLRRMRAHYENEGGYQPETARLGAVRSLSPQGERVVGGETFHLFRVDFTEGSWGVFVITGEGGRAAVDWEYAVGYGEVRPADLVAERPAVPVMLRGYLSEGRYYSGGFTEAQFRQFNFEGPGGGTPLTVYAPRGGPVEESLRDAWFDASVNAVGAPDAAKDTSRLDFVLRLRYETDGLRSGFVIHEVVARGWILPSEPQ
jgi:hypothetical protein